jgi:hypothetical protein
MKTNSIISDINGTVKTYIASARTDLSALEGCMSDIIAKSNTIKLDDDDTSVDNLKNFMADAIKDCDNNVKFSDIDDEPKTAPKKDNDPTSYDPASDFKQECLGKNTTEEKEEKVLKGIRYINSEKLYSYTVAAVSCIAGYAMCAVAGHKIRELQLEHVINKCNQSKG